MTKDRGLGLFDEDGVVADDFEDAYFGSAGYGLSVGDGGQFLNGTLEGVLYLALSLAVAGDAKVDIGYLTHAVADLKGSVVFEMTHLFVYEAENGHKDAASQERADAQQHRTLDCGRQADTAPTYSKQEVDDVADREKLQRAASIQCASIGVAAHIEIDIGPIGITNADECHNHLNEENR